MDATDLRLRRDDQTAKADCRECRLREETETEGGESRDFLEGEGIREDEREFQLVNPRTG
jgi:hypothetical protein